jgi:hypothetical protein
VPTGAPPLAPLSVVVAGPLVVAAPPAPSVLEEPEGPPVVGPLVDPVLAWVEPVSGVPAELPHPAERAKTSDGPPANQARCRRMHNQKCSDLRGRDRLSLDRLVQRLAPYPAPTAIERLLA